MRLYVTRDVTRDTSVIVVSRTRLKVPGGQVAQRPWSSLIETTVPSGRATGRRPSFESVLVTVPPIAAGLITAAFAPLEAGVAVGGAVFFAASYLAPVLRRRRAVGGSTRGASGSIRGGASGPGGNAGRADAGWANPRRADAGWANPGGANAGWANPAGANAGRTSVSRADAGRAGGTVMRRVFGSRGRSADGPGSASAPWGIAARAWGRKSNAGPALVLAGTAERAAFDTAVGVADRISETWPRLASLIDVTEAEALLAEALWEIAGVLARRQELAAVLAGLSRPDFAAHSPADETARDLRASVHATKAALADLDRELARREASLRRAEVAGHNFIREQEMRSAIRAAEDSLRTAHHLDLGATPTQLDAGAELAEQTRSVLDAYRELTTNLHPHQS